MRFLLDDVRYALRALRKNPVLASVAILSLGVGIGANTAIFSLMDRLLFRALDIRDPERVVLLRSAGGWSGSVDTNYGDDVSFSWSKYRALREQSRAVFEGASRVSRSRRASRQGRRRTPPAASWCRGTTSSCSGCARRLAVSSRTRTAGLAGRTRWRC